MLTAKLMSCANIGSCAAAVTLTSALAILLIMLIMPVSFNSFTDKERFVA